MSTEVDVRIIAATNADLPAMALNGEFKQDLLDRLSFEVLFLPPLRERVEDIMLLANHFASRMAYEMSREDIPRFSRNAQQALENYLWPGNIRELKNMVERAVYRSNSKVITDIVFDPFVSPYESRVSHSKEDASKNVPAAPDDCLMDKPLYDAVNELKIRLVEKALVRAKYNQRAAAERLGLTYHQFRGLYRKYKERINRT